MSSIEPKIGLTYHFLDKIHEFMKFIWIKSQLSDQNQIFYHLAFVGENQFDIAREVDEK